VTSASSAVHTAVPIHVPKQCRPMTVVAMTGTDRAAISNVHATVVLRVGDHFRVTADGPCGNAVDSTVASGRRFLHPERDGFVAKAPGTAVVAVTLPTCARLSCLGGIGTLAVLRATIE
jgi:hypothetical protein